MQELENAYRTLDLEPGASMEEVNQAYKDLVFIWHPDRLPKDNLRLIEKAQEKIKQLNQARDYLRTHARMGATSSGNTAGYRSRTRPYGRSAAEASYHTSNAYSGYSAEGTRSTYTPPQSPNPNRYTQSRYSAYSGYGTRHHTYRYSSNSQESRDRPYGNGASTEDGRSPRPSSTTGARTASGNANNHAASSPNPARDNSYGRGSHASNPGRSASPNHNDGWNNYSSYRSSTSNGYGSYYRGSAAQSSTHRDRPPTEEAHRAQTSYGASPPRSASPPSSHARANTEPTPSRPRQHNPDLSGANFRGANLREKDFSGRNLSSADLAGADLQDAFLHGVNLNRADLSNANLFRANLLQANLSHANLRGANLLGADLSGADLSGADLSGAKVAVGDRIMVKLTGTLLRGTIMPDGTINA